MPLNVTFYRRLIQSLLHERSTIAAMTEARPADLVERVFQAVAPKLLWVADLTYVATCAGTVYVSFVIDVFSRRIVGCWNSRLRDVGTCSPEWTRMTSGR